MLGYVKKAVVRFGLAVLGLVMSIHVKRIMLLTTLHLHMVREGVFQDETLHKLNTTMHLAKWDDALLFPASMYERIWDKVKLQQAIQDVVNGRVAEHPLNPDDVRRVSERVVAVSPQWLRYGRRDDMINDMINLFSCQVAGDTKDIALPHAA